MPWLKFATWNGLSLLLVAWPAGSVGPQPLTVTGQVVIREEARLRKRPDNSNVVVWLTPLDALPGRTPATPDLRVPQSFRIIQHHKQFFPHLRIVPVGAEVKFPNLDPFFHNVFSLFEGKRFDLGLYEAGSTRTVKFDRPGVCYIFCNIHPEMSAVVVVLDTPYSGISDTLGEIQIPGVLPGRYRLGVWSEMASPAELKALSRVVTISENSTFLGPFRLSGGNQLVLQHANKYGQAYDTPTPSNPLYEQP